MNVEWCNQTGSIKYLFKYINKGPDRVSAQLYEPTTTADGQQVQKPVDEIKAFNDCRYLSACEAAWRIFRFEIHYRTPSVEHLSFHLQGEQQVLYDENSDLETVIHQPTVGQSMFEGWMKMNELYPATRDLTYAEFPTKYVWNAAKRIWRLRKQGKSIGRIHSVPASTGEAFYCRMLLNSAKGCMTHDDIKEVNGVVYPTYKESFYAAGLLEDDKEYVECIKDYAHWAPPEQLRELFVTLLSQKELTTPLTVWLQTWHLLAEDVQYKRRQILNVPGNMFEQYGFCKGALVHTLSAADKAIIRLESQVANLFRQFLVNQGFRETPPSWLIGTSQSEAASLVQSPQLYNQMAICGDLGRVFSVAAVFASQDSSYKFTCLEVEMEIYQSYYEVMNIVDTLFVEMFYKLNQTCQKELEDVRKQYPFKPLKYLRKTLRLTFEQGIQMLKEAGVEVDPLGDLNKETEKTLGKLVSEKYGNEFYILHRYPLAVRPFYTMPCGAYSNSFDAFIRGEKIISGSQRIHSLELLESRAKECGIDVTTISEYIDFFRYGTAPHAGFGAGLECVVMLFCGLKTPKYISFP